MSKDEGYLYAYMRFLKYNFYLQWSHDNCNILKKNAIEWYQSKNDNKPNA